MADGEGVGEVVVSWDVVAGATHYRVGYVNMVTDYPRAKASATGDWQSAFVYVDEDARNLTVVEGSVEYVLRRLEPGARHAFTVLTSGDAVSDKEAMTGTYSWSQNPRWVFHVVGSGGTAMAQSSGVVVTAASTEEPTPSPTRGQSQVPPQHVQDPPLPASTNPTLAPTPTLDPSDCATAPYHASEWGIEEIVPRGAHLTFTLAQGYPAGRDGNGTTDVYDNHVSTLDAHRSGGCNWTSWEKHAFASRELNKWGVDQAWNNIKGERRPDEIAESGDALHQKLLQSRWGTGGAICLYARQHQNVKEQYGLTMTPEEERVVKEWLRHCG